jgi:hypothetical protein
MTELQTTATDLESAVQKALPFHHDTETLPPDNGTNYKPFYTYDPIIEDAVDDMATPLKRILGPEFKTPTPKARVNQELPFFRQDLKRSDLGASQSRPSLEEIANTSSEVIKEGSEGGIGAATIGMGSIEISRIYGKREVDGDEALNNEESVDSEGKESNRGYGSRPGEDGMADNSIGGGLDADEDDEAEKTRDMIARIVENPEKSFILLDEHLPPPSSPSSIKKKQEVYMEHPIASKPWEGRIAATEGKSLLRELMQPPTTESRIADPGTTTRAIVKGHSSSPSSKFRGVTAAQIQPPATYDTSLRSQEPYSKATMDYLVKYGLLGDDSVAIDASADLDSVSHMVIISLSVVAYS